MPGRKQRQKVFLRSRQCLWQMTFISTTLYQWIFVCHTIVPEQTETFLPCHMNTEQAMSNMF